MPEYDYLIVGAGLFGSVFARQMTDAGYRCLLLDKRRHIGGNVYTENREGINVHMYGAHIFHTNDKEIWEYVNRFAAFNNYRHKVFVSHLNRLLSFPINLMTLHQLWGVNTPEAAVQLLENKRVTVASPANLEEWIVSQVGTELYEIFIKGYTRKQWGRHPKDLPASIIKRIPIRTDFNDFYFDDVYQGIPTGGYTAMIAQMLAGIEVKTGIDFFAERDTLEKLANNIVFTGKIDEFFDFKLGVLEYRTVNFETSLVHKLNYQGTAVVNFTEEKIPYTRILEHKHFEFGKQPVSIITKEFPSEWTKGKEPYYPVNDQKNNAIYNNYKQLAAQHSQYIFGGRLAEYKYYDMHQVIGSALAKSKKLIESLK